MIAEYLATGQAPRRRDAPLENLYTIRDLVADFVSDPDNRYEKNGRPTSENDLIKMALKRLIQSHLDVPVVEFGPIAFRGVLGVMIDDDLARTTIQKLRGRILRTFKWAVANEKCPASVYEALRTVPSPRKGRGRAREPEPVQPVSDEVIEKTLPHLEPMVAAMVRLQRLTGMRPGEVCTIRGKDLDTENYSDDDTRVWVRGANPVGIAAPWIQVLLAMSYSQIVGEG